MRDAFDAFEYFNHVGRRWRLIALTCAIAFSLALVVSLLLPKRYTATASLVIEPPATNDPRTATSISPIYLESLKSYERFAASDTLFASAAAQFHLPTGSIESLKRRVLKVSKIRDTKILEIAATLPDPKQAQQFAQFLAEGTVALSSNAALASDREQIAEATKELDRAQAKLNAARVAYAANAATEPVQALQAEIDSSGDVLTRLEHDLAMAEADPDPVTARARVEVLQRRLDNLQRTMVATARTLSQRTAHAEQVQTDLNASESAFEAASRRLVDLRAAAGSHGERLRVIDPGVVPEKPSSPNVVLNVLAALLAAIVASLLFVTLEFAYRRAAPRRFEPTQRPHVAAR